MSFLNVFLSGNVGVSPIVVPPKPGLNPGFFKYNVKANANKSAAIVEDLDGNVIKTIWGIQAETPGDKIGFWDGTKNDGTVAPFGSYRIRVNPNGVKARWNGVIGNTSKSFTGDQILKGENIEDICFVGNKGFFANGYSEHSSGQKMLLLTDLQQMANARYEQSTQNTYKCCTDGTSVFYFGYSLNNYEGATSYVFKANPADNANPYSAMPAFSNGVPMHTFNSGNGSTDYASVCGLIANNWNSRPTGFDVQKSGNYIFLCRAGMDLLQVINKNTGTLVKSYPFTRVFDAACDDSNNLWLTIDKVLHKFTVNADGTLTDQNINYSGINKATCLGISPDYSTISVGDNGTFQVKSFSTSTNQPVWTLGQSGGYSTNVLAANDKFFFIHFIKYAPDGSIFIGDKENYRTVVFNADRTYKDFISFIPTLRTVTADQNDVKRVFAGFVEYERDYTKTLDNGYNGSWKLKANWKYGIDDLIAVSSFLTESLLDNYSGFYNVQTLSNGRTYGKVFIKNDGVGKEAEMLLTGLRYTGADGKKAVGRDGTLFWNTNGNEKNNTLIYKQKLTGFDTNGNPVRENPVLFCQTPENSNALYPYDPGNGYEANIGHIDTSEGYLFFNRFSPPNNGHPNDILGTHSGYIRKGDNKYVHKSSPSTHTDYYGAYPANGDFDIGNGFYNNPSQHSDTRAMVYDDFTFWNANAEFFKGAQANEWNLINTKNGLPIVHFGISNVKNNNGIYGMAGNALANSVIKYQNRFFVQHCDESIHAGVHEWEIYDLDTIDEQVVNITLSATPIILQDAFGLLKNIPFRSAFAGNDDWIIDQPAGFQMYSGTYQYKKELQDLAVSSNNQDVIVRRKLNNAVSLSKWVLEGGIGMHGSESTLSGGRYNLFEVLDTSNRVIFEFQVYAVPANGYYSYLLVNGNISIIDGAGDRMYNQNTDLAGFKSLRYDFNDFKLYYEGSKLMFKLHTYPLTEITHTRTNDGADMSKPAFIRVRQGGQTNNMVFYKLRFEY